MYQLFAYKASYVALCSSQGYAPYFSYSLRTWLFPALHATQEPQLTLVKICGIFYAHGYIYGDRFVTINCPF